MTAKERRNASIINGSRRKRIALGAGVQVSEVNNLLKQHAQMSKMFKTMGSGGGGKMQQRLVSQMGSGQRSEDRNWGFANVIRGRNGRS